MRGGNTRSSQRRFEVPSAVCLSFDRISEGVDCRVIPQLSIIIAPVQCRPNLIRCQVLINITDMSENIKQLSAYRILYIYLGIAHDIPNTNRIINNLLRAACILRVTSEYVLSRFHIL
jgi:hypothetical protein